MKVKEFFKHEYERFYNEEPWLIKDSKGIPILQVAHRDKRYFVMDSHGDMGLNEPSANVKQIVSEWLDSWTHDDPEMLNKITIHRLLED